MARSEPAATSLLLVEDNEVEREGLAVILRREGFAVAEAATGNEALVRLRAAVPAVILLDMLLPEGMDGWSLLQTIRDVPEWAQVPVIIITGLGVASFEWAQALGALDVVRKPIATDELLQKVRALLG